MYWEIPRGNSILTSDHVDEKKHYKKSDFVLVKSIVPFYGQVDKALRSISHWLVSLLAPIFARWWIQSRSTRMSLLLITLHRQFLILHFFDATSVSRERQEGVMFAMRIFLMFCFKRFCEWWVGRLLWAREYSLGLNI